MSRYLMKITQLGCGSLFLAVLFAVGAPTAHAQQMSIPGQFSVSETGAATYTIPIQVPPGVAGMEPKLALVYNSQSGNGLLGMGWSLSGLSAITRCPRTMAQDGVRGSVNFDLNDRYCLDGQRLILVSGTEGGNSAEYRTERENFSKIVAYTDPSNTGGPAKFLVKTKAGLTMEYGYTADSRIEAQGKTAVRVWAINKVKDTKLAQMNIQYLEDNSAGEFFCSQITYGAADLVNFINVNFIHVARPDVIKGFIAGTATKISKLLTQISVSAGLEPVTATQLIYAPLISPARSQLANIRVCDAANQCVAETAVSIISAANSKTVLDPILTIAINENPDRIVEGDFNGDGLTDLYFFWRASGRNRLYLKQVGTGFTQYQNPILATEIDGSPDNILTGDFNGDGLADIFFSWKASGQNMLYIGNGFGGFSGLTNPIGPVAINGSPDTLLSGDFNGDGLTDLFFTWKAAGTNRLYLTRLAGGFDQYLDPIPIVAINGSPDHAITGDFNGDGLTDAYFTWKLTGTNRLYYSNGLGGFQGYSNPISASAIDGSPDRVLTGDFNGDGLHDIYFFWSVSGQNRLYLAMGSGVFEQFLDPIPAIAINGVPDEFSTGDFNGDGLTDVYFTWGATGKNRLYVSTGSGEFFGYMSPIGPDGIDESPDRLLTGDFNGDGISDAYFIWGASGQNRLSYMGLEKPSRVGVITSLPERRVEITYSPLSTASFYVKGSGAVYPNLNIQGPLHVVPAFSSSDGVGGVRQMTYRYGNAMVELGTGRGFLGFQWVQSEDVSTGLASRAWYRQDWPFTGLVSKAAHGTSAASLTNLGITTYTYDCTDFDATPGCLSAPGKRYFPYSTRVEEKRWDLNGTALPITRTDTIHDCISTSTACFGNALDLTVSTLNPDGSPSGYSKRTQSQFHNDTNNWILGRLLKSSVIHTAP